MIYGFGTLTVCYITYCYKLYESAISLHVPSKVDGLLWSILVPPVIIITGWKVSKYRVFPGPYFPVFGLNPGKYGQEKNPYLDTLQAVL